MDLRSNTEGTAVPTEPRRPIAGTVVLIIIDSASAYLPPPAPSDFLCKVADPEAAPITIRTKFVAPWPAPRPQGPLSRGRPDRRAARWYGANRFTSF